MNRLTLISLTLTNFKAIRELHILANGCNLSVFGDNETGKTTIADAILWLLFDKDSNNRTKFHVKTLDETGNAIHYLDHCVQGVFETSNGDRLTFKKLLKENWVKARGSDKSEFQGHVTKYWVNDVPCETEREYLVQVAKLCDQKLFRLLSEVTYFNTVLNDDQRRALLLEVCGGDITDADVIASNSKLSDLTAILGKNSLDDHKKIVKARQTAINDRLKEIPQRIDEANRSMGEAKTIAPDAEANLQKAILDLQTERAGLINGTGASEKTIELRAVEDDLLLFSREFEAAYGETTKSLEAEIEKAVRAWNGAKNELFVLEQEKVSKETALSRIDATLNELRSEWKKVDAEMFLKKITDTCPACGQSLPAEEVSAAVERALEEFNLSKSTRLEKLVADSRVEKQRAATLTADVEALDAKIQQAKNDVETLGAAYTALEEKSNQGQAEKPVLAEAPKYKELAAKREELVGQISELRISAEDAIASVDKDIETIAQELRELQAAIATNKHRASIAQRIEELSAEEKALSAEYDKLEKELFLTEQFVKSKVELLEKRINSKFEIARFKMFEPQINGGIRECCETTVNGVPYSTNLNTAAKINVGLDIIRTLSAHFGFAPMIVIDNAESVTSLVSTPAQQIRLVVSANDKELRFDNTDALDIA